MDEQLKKELQEALYGALAAIYQNNQPKDRKKKSSQETKVEIVVSGNSLSLIKALADDKEIDNKITKVAKAFEILNNSLKNFGELKVMNPAKSAGLQSLLALLNFITQDGFFMKMTKANIAMRLVAAKTIRDFFKAIGNVFNDEEFKSLNIGNINKKIKGINAILNLFESIASVGFLTKISLASLMLSERKGQSIAKFFNGFIDTLSESKNTKEIDAAGKALKSITELVDQLTKSIILIAGTSLIISALNPVGTIATMSIIILMEIGLIWSILNIVNKIDFDKSLKGVEAINIIVANIGRGLIALAVSSAIIQIGGGYRSWLTTLSLMLTYSLVVGLLAAEAAYITTIGPQAIEGVKVMGDLVKSLGIGMLAIGTTGAIIESFGTSFWATLGYLLFTVLFVGGMAIVLAKFSDPVKEGKGAADNLAKLVLALGAALLLVGVIGALVQYVDMTNVGKATGILIGTMVFGGIVAAIMRNQGTDMMKGMLGLGALILAIGITVLLVGVTATIAKSIDTEALVKTGAILLTVMIFTGIVAYIMKARGADMMKGIAELAILTLGIGLNVVLLAAAARIADGISWSSVWQIGTLIVFELILLGLLALASKFTSSVKVKKDLFMLELLMTGLIANVGLVALVTKLVDSTNWEDLGKVLSILAVEGAIMVAIGYAAKLMNSAGVTKDMAILELLMAGILAIVYGAIKVLNEIRAFGWTELLNELAKMGTIFAGIAALGASIGFAAFAIVPAIAGLAILEPFLAGLLGIIYGFIKIVKMYKKDNIDFAEAGKELGTGLNSFIDNFASFGNAARLAMISAVIYTISIPLMAMMFTIGKFVSIVKDVATMNFVVGYDDNGKPVYERVDPSVFGKAANVVSEGFNKFISELVKGAKEAKGSSLTAILLLSAAMVPITKALGNFVDSVMKLAIGKYQIGDEIVEVSNSQFEHAATVVSEQFKIFLTKLSAGFESLSIWSIASIKLIGDNMSPVMDAVSSFTDSILKLATGTYITGYDVNGKPEFKEIPKDAYSNAAEAISKNFGTFLETLTKESNNLSWTSESSLEAISEAIVPVMEGVSKFVDAIMKVAAGTILVGYDENGKPMYTPIKDDDVSLAARRVSGYFLGFVKKLIELSDGVDRESRKAIKRLSESIGPLMESIGNFANALVKMSSSTYIVGYDENGKPRYETIDQSVYKEAANTLATGLSDFVEILTTKLAPIQEKAAKNINSITKGGLMNLMKAVAKFSDILTKNMFVITGYDENGKPIYEIGDDGKPVLTSEYFPTIASSLGMSFGMFLNILSVLLKPLEPEAEALSTTLNNLKVVFDPLAKFTKSLSEYFNVYDKINKDSGGDLSEFSKGIGKTLKAFFDSLYGDNKLEEYSKKVKELNDFRKSVNEAVATALLLQKIVNIDTKKINDNIIEFKTALSNLMENDMPQKSIAFTGGVEKIKESMNSLKDSVSGMPGMTAAVQIGFNAGMVTVTMTTSQILNTLSKFDLGVQRTVKNVFALKKEFVDTIDKIEAKLKKNETERNKMLKDLTTHLDTIGNKLKTISSGLKEINSSSMDKVEELAKVFAEMQQRQIQMMVEYVSSNKPDVPQMTSTQQPQIPNNNFNIAGQQNNVPNNYFGDAFEFTIKESYPGQIRGIMQRMT